MVVRVFSHRNLESTTYEVRVIILGDLNHSQSYHDVTVVIGSTTRRFKCLVLASGMAFDAVLISLHAFHLRNKIASGCSEAMWLQESDARSYYVGDAMIR